MSRIDYSKFDHIDDDSDCESNNNNSTAISTATTAGKREASSTPIPTIPSDTAPVLKTRKGKEGRLQYTYEDRVIYEWEQSLEEVNIFITPPPGLTRHLIDISIQHQHLKVGIKGNPPFLDESTGGPVKIAESMWTLVDGEININLQKMNKAEQWNCALLGKGASVDAYTQEEVKKKLMIERFQEEHPSFDFSHAEFNGEVPSARNFMGGISRS